MGQKPSISYRQRTGYYSYMFHNNKAFCKQCLSSFIDPRPLAIQSHTRERRRILNLHARVSVSYSGSRQAAAPDMCSKSLAGSPCPLLATPLVFWHPTLRVFLSAVGGRGPYYYVFLRVVAMSSSRSYVDFARQEVPRILAAATEDIDNTSSLD